MPSSTDLIVYFLFGMLFAFIVVAVSAVAAQAKGKALKKKFVNLGNFRDKTLDEIVSAVGPPKATLTRADGLKVAQWLEVGYGISIVLDQENRCQGIDTELRM